MKKAFICILACLLAVLSLAGCKGKKTEATRAVEEMIGALGEITVDSADAISAAQRAYAALSPEEKERVKNYDKLTEAAEKLKAEQTRFAGYDEMNALISEIVKTAASTFTEDGTDFSGLIEKGGALLETYKKMSEEEKAYVHVTEEFEKALKLLSESADVSAKAAAEYVKAFRNVYADKKYEVTAVYCIKQIRDETQFHIFALTYKDEDGAEHNLYANARCSAETKADVMAQNADVFFAANSVSYTINAVENGNVTLDLENVLKLAG